MTLITFTSGTKAKSSEVNSNFEELQSGVVNNQLALVPVGSVTSWLKSYTNTPALPENWVECNGQTLNDEESPYHGQVIPNLNGDNRFLRGNSTSGATGGSATHNHKYYTYVSSNDNSFSGSANPGGRSYNSSGNTINLNLSGTVVQGDLYTEKVSTLPPYYNVTWIMRIK